ncbi:MAG: hypothetical protein WC244_04925 [Patescibacteria group bacterium]|jgi:hypothetical protein
MSKDYKQLFSHVETLEPPQALLGHILLRLENEKKLVVLKRRVAFFSVGLIFSVLALIPAFQLVWNGISSSGFVQFLSLLFTDSEIVMAYWQSFALTLLESLPALSIIIFLTIIFTLLGSARLLSKNIKIIHNLKLT